MPSPSDKLVVAAAQLAPVWLDRDATLARVVDFVHEAGREGAALVAFGEALVPGYPFWLSITDGARFDSAVQKRLHAAYLEQAVAIESNQLDAVQRAAADHGITVVLGVVERAIDRGGHSLYCSLVTIGGDGEILSVHRKLVPTYEERLSWAPGDGHGLKTHPLGRFTLGALNCWENWLPLARASLHAQGEDLHVAAWPGSQRNTEDISRFMAKEGRSYVVSVSGLLRKGDIPTGFPCRDEVLAACPDTLADGGSAVAGPDGAWVRAPVTNQEALILAELDHARVREERQNLDVSGHYSRPDVLRLTMNTKRQRVLDATDERGP